MRTTRSKGTTEKRVLKDARPLQSRGHDVGWPGSRCGSCLSTGVEGLTRTHQRTTQRLTGPIFLRPQDLRRAARPGAPPSMSRDVSPIASPDCVNARRCATSAEDSTNVCGGSLVLASADPPFEPKADTSTQGSPCIRAMTSRGGHRTDARRMQTLADALLTQVVDEARKWLAARQFSKYRSRTACSGACDNTIGRMQFRRPQQ